MQISYRKILNQTFQERSLLNPSYSLRSYARDLGVPPSTLSEVLNGKKGISTKRSLDLAKKLKLPEWQVQLFCDLVTKEHAKKPSARKEAAQRLQDRKQENHMRLVNHVALKALLSWVDLAILEITYLKNFKGSTSWIAKQLKVTEQTIEASIKRLMTAKLLEITDDGVWKDVSPLFCSTDGIPNELIRNFHKTVLQVALKKIDNADLETRAVKTVVFSLSKENREKAKRVLDEAIGKIVSLADESSQKRDDVMCFSAQLFSLLSNNQGDPI